MTGKVVRLGIQTAFAAVLIVSCARSAPEPGLSDSELPEIRPIAVEGIEAVRSALVTVIRSAGIVQGIREAWVVSEAEGLIREVGFSLGRPIAAGQVLLTLEGELAASRRELARSRYETALLEFEAARKSQENGSISALQFSRTRDSLLSAKSALDAAVDSFENTMIKAPFSGAAAARGENLSIGNYITRGVRVARIVDNSAFQTEVSVGEGQILLIREGAAARITGKDGRTRTGRVSAVSAGSDGSTGSFTVVVEWTPPGDDVLKSGMSVDVAVDVSDNNERIIIPASAIRLRGGESFIYVDKGGSADFRRISTAGRLGERVEVLEGLDEGEIVITSGIGSLSPGRPVRTSLVSFSGDFQ